MRNLPIGLGLFYVNEGRSRQVGILPFSMERQNCLKSIYYMIFGAFYVTLRCLVDIFGRLYLYLVDISIYLFNFLWP